MWSRSNSSNIQLGTLLKKIKIKKILFQVKVDKVI